MREKNVVLLLLVAIAVTTSACVSLPWRREVPDEKNVAVVLSRNLLIATQQVNGHEARVMFGSAHARTVIDSRFAKANGISGTATIRLGEKERITVRPIAADLGAVADLLIGSDAWQGMSVTFDYRKQLVTLSSRSRRASDLAAYRFAGSQPEIPVVVDGRQLTAVVDTANPDTLLLPANGDPRRVKSIVTIGGQRFETDIVYANVSEPRLGNRLLSEFLVTIDYRRREVRLWKQP